MPIADSNVRHIRSTSLRLRIGHNVLISGIALIASFVLAISPDIFDRPLTGLIYGFAGRSVFFDRSTFIVFSSPAFSGQFWSHWFGPAGSIPLIQKAARIFWLGH